MSDNLGGIDLADLETGQMRQLIDIDVIRIHVAPLTLSKQGNRLLYGSASTAFLVDITSGERVQTLRGHDAMILDLLLSADGQLAITASIDKTVRIWDLASGEDLMQLTGHQGAVTSLALAPDDKSLLTSSLDGTANLWDLESDQIIYSFDIGPALPPITDLAVHFPTLGVSLSPNGDQLLISTTDQKLQMYDRQTGSC